MYSNLKFKFNKIGIEVVTKLDNHLVLKFMRRGKNTDKDFIVNILLNSFDDNKSVNYIITQDSKRRRRIRELMEYSYECCNLFEDVFLSDDQSGCALILKPDNKKATLKSILMDIKFMIKCLGIFNIKKALTREAEINRSHPDGLLYYSWFIGVSSDSQGKGVGSRLMKEIISEGRMQNRKICLETSTLKNLPWYKKFGFTIYNELDFGYKLYCLKHD